MRPVDYLLLDQKICALASSIEANLLSYVNPQNLAQQRQKFFEELQNGNEYNPSFSYSPRNPLYSYFSISPTFSTYKRELAALLPELGDDSLDMIFSKKISDLFLRMELIRSVGTENFANNSEKYYGTVTLKLLSLAHEIISREVGSEEKKIPFERAKGAMQEALKKSRLKYRIAAKGLSASSCSANVRTKTIFLDPDKFFSRGEVERLVAHEIEGHIFRYENGMLQPYCLFARGLSKETLCTEEGIAVNLEERRGINVAAQLREYAGRVLAVHYAMRKSFYETFKELSEFFPPESAFNLAVRAKRGTFSQEQPGAFTKDTLYLRGKLAVERFLRNNSLEELYFGRYSVYDFPLVKEIEGLVKPKYLPAALNKKK